MLETRPKHPPSYLQLPSKGQCLDHQAAAVTAAQTCRPPLLTAQSNPTTGHRNAQLLSMTLRSLTLQTLRIMQQLQATSDRGLTAAWWQTPHLRSRRIPLLPNKDQQMAAQVHTSLAPTAVHLYRKQSSMTTWTGSHTFQVRPCCQTAAFALSCHSVLSDQALMCSSAELSCDLVNKAARHAVMADLLATSTCVCGCKLRSQQ